MLVYITYFLFNLRIFDLKKRSHKTYPSTRYVFVTKYRIGTQSFASLYDTKKLVVLNLQQLKAHDILGIVSRHSANFCGQVMDQNISIKLLITLSSQQNPERASFTCYIW